MSGRIMYVEEKDGGIRCALEGGARIGRVDTSKTGKTLRYRGMQFRSLKGFGFKANYYEIDTGAWYWISGCRKDGNDALYPAIVEIDDDVRDEYWRRIREQPARAAETSFRSTGKHTSTRGPSSSHEGAKTSRGRAARRT